MGNGPSSVSVYSEAFHFKNLLLCPLSVCVECFVCCLRVLHELCLICWKVLQLVACSLFACVECVVRCLHVLNVCVCLSESTSTCCFVRCLHVSNALCLVCLRV